MCTCMCHIWGLYSLHMCCLLCSPTNESICTCHDKSTVTLCITGALYFFAYTSLQKPATCRLGFKNYFVRMPVLSDTRYMCSLAIEHTVHKKLALMLWRFFPESTHMCLIAHCSLLHKMSYWYIDFVTGIFEAGWKSLYCLKVNI